MLSAKSGKDTENVRKAIVMFYVHSGCSESTRNPAPPKCSFRMHQELDACFPNVFRTCRMFLEYSRIHMNDTFRWSIKIILKMHKKLLELLKVVPYASVRNRTTSVLLEHTESFPNMISSLPENPNSYSENKRNGIRTSVIGP